MKESVVQIICITFRHLKKDAWNFAGLFWRESGWLFVASHRFDQLCRLKPDMILRLIESFISTVNERDARWGSTLGLARTGQRNDGVACDAKTPGRRRRRSFVGRTTCGKTLQGILFSVRDDIFSGRDSRKKYSDLACPIYMAFSFLNNTYLLYMYIDQNSRKILSSIFF